MFIALIVVPLSLAAPPRIRLELNQVHTHLSSLTLTFPTARISYISIHIREFMEFLSPLRMGSPSLFPCIAPSRDDKAPAGHAARKNLHTGIAASALYSIPFGALINMRAA